MTERLCVVVVPDFEYLKANRIANAREAIRFDFDTRGHELPEYQRVRDYIVRAEPLPRTAIRKVRRFELKQQIEQSNAVARQARDLRQLLFSEADRGLMDTAAGRALANAIRHHVPNAAVIHPQMNLELDLGLDSLARAECIARVEQSLGVEFDSAAVASALTVFEIVTVANGDTGNASQNLCEGSPSAFDWREILRATPNEANEFPSILKSKRVTVFAIFVFLQLFHLLARVFLRMEVRGLEHVNRLERPFLICPNHQSYFDPLLVCSNFPRRTLRHVFHVGASEYWNNPVAGMISSQMNIIPVDPDTNLLRAMRAGAIGIRAGKILNIYPEGERSFEGSLHAFKKGAAILASALDVPIVPVALDGLYKVWPRGSNRIRLARIKIHFGEPINPRAVIDAADEAAGQRITALLRDRIQTMLDEMRSEGRASGDLQAGNH